MIGEQLADAREGRGAVLFVQGRAGFGKTRLLAEAAAMASQAGVRAGLGAVQASDQVVPMAGLIAALFDGREPLVDPAARHRLHFLPEQRYWLLEELESLLEQAALASPVLVCIDDMHWADGGSLTALRTLPPRLAHLPIMWLVSFREGQAQAELRAAIESLDEIGAQSLTLGPLDGDAVEQVVGVAVRTLHEAARAAARSCWWSCCVACRKRRWCRPAPGTPPWSRHGCPPASPTACAIGSPVCPNPRGRPRSWRPCWDGGSPSATCRRC